MPRHLILHALSSYYTISPHALTMLFILSILSTSSTDLVSVGWQERWRQEKESCSYWALFYTPCHAEAADRLHTDIASNLMYYNLIWHGHYLPDGSLMYSLTAPFTPLSLSFYHQTYTLHSSSPLPSLILSSHFTNLSSLHPKSHSSLTHPLLFLSTFSFS